MKRFLLGLSITLTCLINSVYAATLTVHAEEQILSSHANGSFLTGLSKNALFTFYNPNSFDVNIRLSVSANALDELGFDQGFDLFSQIPLTTITIPSASKYTHNQIIAFPGETDGGNSVNSDFIGMCDLGMYQTITPPLGSNSFFNCNKILRTVTISWNESVLRNTGTIKTVAPITGQVTYYFKRTDFQTGEGGSGGEGEF